MVTAEYFEEYEKRLDFYKAQTQWLEAEKRLAELRYNEYHDPKSGKFTTDGKNFPKGVDKSGNGGIIKATPEQRKEFISALNGTKAPNNIIIKNISSHAADRMVERNISVDTVKEALSVPEIEYPGNAPNSHCVQKNGVRIVYSNKGTVITAIVLQE